MKFKYSVIGDNTPKNREWLEKIGKRRTSSIKGNVLFTQEDTYYCFTLEGGNNLIFDSTCIDARDNDALFRAVSAIRNETNINKWFHLKEDANVNTDIRVRPCYKVMYCSIYEKVPNIYREATIAELQEHFKV